MAVFRHTRDLSASPAAVFDAFQDPARLARWWGPAGFTNTFHTFEFTPDGAWRFTMHGPNGKDYPNESQFVELVPNALVRLRHVNLPHYDLSITLESTTIGTLLTWVGIFENDAFAESMRDFLQTANEQNLDRLAQELGLTRGADHSAHTVRSRR